MSVTIRDIAARAGVSIMTVSRVMNSSGYVSAKTRQRVEEAVKALGYQPNLLARSLINRKSSFVYVIVPDIANPFYAELTRGVERIAREEGYSIILSNAHWDTKMECEHIEAARGRMAEGIILVLPMINEETIGRYARQLPLVVVDRFIHSPEIDRIYIPQEKGAERGVAYLIESGHSRIAFLSGPGEIHNSRVRQDGYEQALRQHGIAFDPDLILPGDFSFESGERALAIIESRSLLAGPGRITALFAASDMMAFGFMRSAFREGIRIPEDISLLGFDDISLASVTNPPLTTIRHPYREMGEEAMKHLLTKLGEGGAPGGSPNESVGSGGPAGLVNTLIIRETTGSIT